MPTITIPWDQLPQGEWSKDLASWTNEDWELATLAIALYRNLEQRLPSSKGLNEPFIKWPDLSEGIARSLWYAPPGTKDRVEKVVRFAILLYSQPALEYFFQRAFLE